MTNESMDKQAFNDLNSPGDYSTANEIVLEELSIVPSGKLLNCPSVVVTDKTGTSRKFQLMQVSFVVNNFFEADRGLTSIQNL
jgi:hypothetical protein